MSFGGAGIAAAGMVASSAMQDSPDVPQTDEAALIQLQKQLNSIDQTTPFGSLTFQGPNKTEAQLEFDPQTQKIVDALQGAAVSQAEQLPTDPFQPDIPAVGGTEAVALGPFDQSTQAQQATFQQAQNLLDPVFERREENLRQTLSNQGLPIGSQAFEGEFNRFERERNRADVNAALQSVQAGNQRQSELFRQGLSALGAEQGVQQQNLGQLQSLLGMAQGAGPQLGSFFGPSATDVMGPAQLSQQGQLAQFNASQQQQQALMGGLSSLGSAAIFSGAGSSE